ncbi:hypothetical protein PENTCL1PPCAC_12089, partial [Pristionchus entomophagus]
QIQAMENIEAKAYIASMLSHALKYRVKNLSYRTQSQGELWEELMSAPKFYLLSAEARVAYEELMKKGFGLIESADIKEYRINNAMN